MLLKEVIARVPGTFQRYKVRKNRLSKEKKLLL